jgi:hypothetical protein
MKNLFFKLSFLAILIFSATKSAYAQTSQNYYVDIANTGGNGCNDTWVGSLSNPFCTVGKALTAVQPGGTVNLRRGVYPSFEVAKSGSSTSYIIIKNYNNEPVKIASTGNGITLRGASFVKIHGFEITGASGSWSGGIKLTSRNGILSNNNIIENNYIHHNLGSGTNGIFIEDGSYNKVINNLVNNNYTSGIRLLSHPDITPNGVTGNEISGNTVYSHNGNPPGSDGIAVSGSKTLNTLIKNNITYDNGDDGIDTWDSQNNTLIANVSYLNGLSGGDGNGFKLGSNTTGGRNIVSGNISYKNEADGFETNGGWGVFYYNNTAYANNGYGFDDGYRNVICDINSCPSKLINNIGYNNVSGNFAASGPTAVSHNNIWFTPGKGADILYRGTRKQNLTDFYILSGNRLDNPQAGNQSSISADPLFVNLSAYDFNLKFGSPAIDKGDPANPGNISFSGSSVDIGAKETGGSSTVPTVTPTYTVTPTRIPTPTSIQGDINGDRVINLQDYILLNNAFGTANSASDINADGVVNIQDYVILSNNFGKVY